MSRHSSCPQNGSKRVFLSILLIGVLQLRRPARRRHSPIMAQSYNTFDDAEAGVAPTKVAGNTRKSVAAGVALLFLAVLGVSTTTRGYSMLDVVRRQRECRTKRQVAAMASDRRPSATLFAHR